MVAGVVGSPVRQSLSPLIHNAWIRAAGLDAVYVPLSLHPDGFQPFVQGLRCGPFCGVNVTLPFKADALALADEVDPAARAAGAANLLLFAPDGRILARNTDGLGLMAAIKEQAPSLHLPGCVTAVVGAGGAARGAVAALLQAGVAQVRVINRTLQRAQELAADFSGAVQAFDLAEAPAAFADVGLTINASSAGMNGRDPLELSLSNAPSTVVVMDMVYKPLTTSLLAEAKGRGLQTVDGLSMLIGQARPSFEAFFGRPAPAEVDVRALALRALGEAA